LLSQKKAHRGIFNLDGLMFIWIKQVA